MAVVVGAVFSYALGAVWYSQKMFGKKWMEGVGNTQNNVGLPILAMVTQAIGTFLLAWVIGVAEKTSSTYFAILIALATLTLIMPNGLWAGKSQYAILTESSFILAMVVIMIAAQVILYDVSFSHSSDLEFYALVIPCHYCWCLDMTLTKNYNRVVYFLESIEERYK